MALQNPGRKVVAGVAFKFRIMRGINAPQRSAKGAQVPPQLIIDSLTPRATAPGSLWLLEGSLAVTQAQGLLDERVAGLKAWQRAPHQG
mmetsp:Transcript_84341/g.172134  ORF Transcript_84341/g.172134 Transcript_84341/m.172134 type:complete len:89 (+) Transcript_84341:2-268(+)